MSPAPRKRRCWRRLTWSRFGAGVCVALIVSGAVAALLPAHRGAPAPLPLPLSTAGARVVSSAAERAAQQVAVAFVVACDTTDPAHPIGDVATEAALAPTLMLRYPVGPAIWRTEDRATTVMLDLPGQPVAVRGDEVAVVVTGVMTVFSDSDPGPPASVPLVERITLRPVAKSAADDRVDVDGRTADGGAPRWQVVGVEVGA